MNQILAIAIIPIKKTTTPATLFIHHIFFNLNLWRKKLTMVDRVNHHDAAPENTPATRLIIFRILCFPSETFIPAKIARKNRMAIGFVIVRKKTEKKSWDSLFLLSLCNLSCLTGFV